MEIEKRVHQIYKEFERAKKQDIKTSQLVGKYQYIYSEGKKEISLVLFLDYFGDGKDFWEIYSLKGSLFNDVERFNTKEEAEKQIKKYLK